MLNVFRFHLFDESKKDLETHFMCIHDKAGYNTTQTHQTTSPYINESI